MKNKRTLGDQFTIIYKNENSLWLQFNGIGRSVHRNRKFLDIPRLSFLDQMVT